jgi:hypothetical protein
MPHRKLFVSLPVRDLARSKEFFVRLGFEIDPKFSGESTASLPLSADASVMLVTEEMFEKLGGRKVCDTRTHLQALVTVSCESRAEVDRLVQLAVENGGKAAHEPEDHGFMYDWSFYDLDGHGWGVMWMDPTFGQT